MRSITKIAIAAAISLAFAASSYDAVAQARRTTSSVSRTTTTSRTTSSQDNKQSSTQTNTPARTSSSSSGSTTRKQSATTTTSRAKSSVNTGKAQSVSTPQSQTGSDAKRQSSHVTRTQSGSSTANQGTSSTQSSSSAQRRSSTQRSSSTQSSTSAQSSSSVRSSSVRRTQSSTDRKNTSASRQQTRQQASSGSRTSATSGVRGNVQRVAPRDRGIRPEPPKSFHGSGNHYFGYRAPEPPHHHVHHYTHWGRDYYFYNDVFYCYRGGHYYICRPYYGYEFGYRKKHFHYAPVSFSYYCSTYYYYTVMDSNWDIIQRQNEQIAYNNALLASQNVSLQYNASGARSAAQIAQAIGLVQSYASARQEYFYDDGVFYEMLPGDKLRVIVPPAGAIVDVLPEDYDTIVFDKVEYYVVDDTVYRLVNIDGTAAFEVLGQMPSSVYSKYITY